MKNMLFCLLCTFSICLHAAEKPRLMLLENYEGQDVSGWLMSEKLDGIRGYWDGEHLISREGLDFSPPTSFLHNFPPFPIDGELYARELPFEAIQSALRSEDEQGWAQLQLWVFDVPDAQGGLMQRLSLLENYLEKNPAEHIRIIEQIPIKNQQHAETFYQSIIQGGGEGIVVRDPNEAYQRYRSKSILKWKPYQEEECIIRAHIPGTGRLENLMGSILCAHPQYGEFRIGTGFTDAERRDPPAIGSRITFRFQELTQKNKPRFPRYLRPRPLEGSKETNSKESF